MRIDADAETAEPQTMAELLAEAEAGPAALQPLCAGELVEGTVASSSGDVVLVDLGGRPSGEIALRDGSAGELEPGDRISAIA
jgi:ribosomal protein S1